MNKKENEIEKSVIIRIFTRICLRTLIVKRVGEEFNLEENDRKIKDWNDFRNGLILKIIIIILYKENMRKIRGSNEETIWLVLWENDRE